MVDKQKNAQIKNDNNNYQKELTGIYYDHILRAHLDGSKQFDKMISTLSAGALALSITFINQIAPSPKPCTIYLLVISWILFLSSLFLTLVSFLKSQDACKERLLQMTGEKDDMSAEDASINTSYYNYLSLTSFSVGVIFIMVFCALNLIK